MTQSDTPLAGQTALITGATSGLGVRFASVLTGAGARVALTGRRTERLAAFAAELPGAAGFALDVTDAESVQRCFTEAEAALGPIGIVVNNAGMNVQAKATELTPADYDRIMNTNAKGAFLVAQEAGRRWLARKQPGRLINVASIGAFRALPGLAVYCMSKAAIAMMTQALAREWARAGINVNAICPGYIETELNADWFASDGGQRQIAGFPRKRLAQESDLDGVLLLLAGPAGAAITGSLFTVDDGQSL